MSANPSGTAKKKYGVPSVIGITNSRLYNSHMVNTIQIAVRIKKQNVHVCHTASFGQTWIMEVREII